MKLENLKNGIATQIEKIDCGCSPVVNGSVLCLDMPGREQHFEETFSEIKRNQCETLPVLCAVPPINPLHNSTTASNTSLSSSLASNLLTSITLLTRPIDGLQQNTTVMWGTIKLHEERHHLCIILLVSRLIMLIDHAPMQVSR